MTSSVRLLGRLDPNFAWDGSRLYDRSDFRPGLGLPVDLRGAVASVEPRPRGPWFHGGHSAAEVDRETKPWPKVGPVVESASIPSKVGIQTSQEANGARHGANLARIDRARSSIGSEPVKERRK